MTSGISAVGSVTSASSAASGADLYRQREAGASALDAMRQPALPAYNLDNSRPGDVFFHIASGKYIGHTNIASTDKTFKIDSVDPDGVRKVSMFSDSQPAIVFRFVDWHIAYNAAKLAEGWAPKGEFRRGQPKPKKEVGYSGGAIGLGVTARVVGNLMGSSHFGTGAQGRLHKYAGRPDMKPKNVICSELCVLAYQLCLRENDAAFPRLDAKHTTPSVLFRYMTQGPGAAFWTMVGRRNFRA
ncbi:hypothetical protein [Roseomonas sp. BN140053]|uniref:hypothetical protein n=1 Tax=Roseomonas sp. BN140053 TaxID=3391898 RepID=UPI0039EC8AD6